MAGDWIKMRTNLWDHPKVVRIVSAVCPQNVRDLSARCRVVGALYRTWSLADAHSADGILDGYTAEALNAVVGIDGWAENMQHVGWLIIEAQRLIVPRFEEHNGTSAKRRADDAARKKSVRKMSEKCPQTNGQNADQRREEKRRVRGNTPNTPVTCADVAIPASLDTPEVRASLDEWLAYKRAKGQGYKKAQFVTHLLDEYASAGPLAFVQAVSYSIGRNYAGIVPPNQGRQQRNFAGPGQTHDPDAAKKDPHYGRM